MTKKVAKRGPGGKFVKGESGNSQGRPKGSKNQVTLLKLMGEEAIREGCFDDMLLVAQMVIQQAKEGDGRSQKMVWDAIMSKGSIDDRTTAREKVEINIGGIIPHTPEVKGITIIQEESSDAESNDQSSQPDE